MSIQGWTRTITALLIVFVAGSAAAAEFERNVVGQRFTFSERSAVLDNLSDRPRVVYDRVVQPAPASWIRLSFERLELGRGSTVRITSLADGETQVLDSRTAAQWRNTSAYFNGDAVRVELVAGPKSVGNILEIGDVWLGTFSDTSESTAVNAGRPDIFDRPGSSWNHVGFGANGISDPLAVPLDICGTDDREATDHPAIARLVIHTSFGVTHCSASLFSQSSDIVSAGHCVTELDPVEDEPIVVEFNVPLSDGSGPTSTAIVHPPIQDQYPAIIDELVSDTDELGETDEQDWALFPVGASSGHSTPFEAQGTYLPIDVCGPSSVETVKVVGYGEDNDPEDWRLSFTQQTGTGSIIGESEHGGYVHYDADTNSGNSGGPVVQNGQIVAIHSTGSCSTSAPNLGMRTSHEKFVDALNMYLGVPCFAIDTNSNPPSAACAALPGGGFGLEVTVTLFDIIGFDWEGESVNITVDGTAHMLTVDEERTATGTFPATTGLHTIQVLESVGCPKEGCYGPWRVMCPFSPGL